MSGPGHRGRGHNSTGHEHRVGAEAEDATSVAAFSFSSEKDATFECSLDGADFEPVPSPRVYDGLTKGTHSFQVAAIDPAGNRDASPAQHDWKVKAKKKRR